MVQEDLCRLCEKWVLVSSDAFCGWCGRPLHSLQLSSETERVFAVHASAAISEGFPAWDKSRQRDIVLAADGMSATIGMTLKNAGQWPVEPVVTADKDWLKVVGAPPTLNPGEEGRFESVLDMTSAPRNEFAVVTVLAEEQDTHEKLEISYVPFPNVEAELESHQICLDSGKETVQGRVVLKTGLLELLKPEAATVDVPWAKVEFPEGTPFPLTMDARNHSELPFFLNVDKDSLSGVSAQLRGRDDNTVWVKMTLQDENFSEINGIQFGVEIRWPPMLVLHGADFDEVGMSVLAGREQVGLLQLSNVGDEQLQVTDIQVQVETDVAWLSVDFKDLPRVLEPNESTELKIAADATRLQTGTHHGTIAIASNSFESADKRLTVSLRVFEQQYDGIIAFDFGTSNSCVVKFDSGGALPEIVPLDSSQLKTVPSIILYEELQSTPDGEHRVYSVGSYAEVAAVDAKAQESFVRSVKSDIGRPLKYPIRFFRDGKRDNLSPEIVAGDIIRYLVNALEDRIQQKVASCVITHPSRFSPLQLDSLRGAFEAQGIAVEAMVHEPVAAALDFIIDHEQGSEEYTILVCDFGGGTTDFALLRVQDKLSGDKRILSPEVLGATACHHFGGDDVTEALALHFASEGSRVLIEGELWDSQKMYLSHEEITQIGNIDDRTRALLNRETIRRLAEESKITCSEDSTAEELVEVNVENHHGEVVTFAVEVNQDILNSSASGGIGDAVDVCQDLLARTLGEGSLDVVLLAGRASQLPLVQKSFAETFTDSTLVFAGQHGSDEAPSSEELKQCVGKGAARFEKIKSYPSPIQLDFAGMKPVATASVGVKGVDKKGVACFKPVIHNGEPLGQWTTMEDAGKKLIFCENVGNDNRLVITQNGREIPNPDIRQLHAFDLRGYVDDDLNALKVEVQLNEVHKVLIRINGEIQETSQVFS